MTETQKLLISEPNTALLPLEDILHKAAGYAADARSQNTIRTYRAAWKDFQAWCDHRELPSLPAEPKTVILYLAELASHKKVSTLHLRLVAISQAHKLQKLLSPTQDPVVSEIMKGICRTHGSSMTQKAAISTPELKAMLIKIPNTLIGCRDKALLLLGFAGGFRRSELVALEWSDLQLISEQGFTVRIRRSKTDATGRGRKIAIPFGKYSHTCPCIAIQSWSDRSGKKDGPVFRSINRHGRMADQALSAKAVALIVKQYAEAAGFDSSKYSGHSLRSGLCTAAAARGVPEYQIMRQTGHRSERIMRQYIRNGTLFTENPVSSLDL